MSPSEIAFLGVGLVIGAAVGAAIAEALRARPAPRHEVRLTISPNTISPRRSATLAHPAGVGLRTPVPGSPEDGAWPEPSPIAARGLPADGPGSPPDRAPGRTFVPSSPVRVPATAVAVPIGNAPSRGTAPGALPAVPARYSATMRGPARPGATSSEAAGPALGLAVGIAVLDPVAPVAYPSAVDIGVPVSRRIVRARPPVADARPALYAGAIPVTAVSLRSIAQAGEDGGGMTEVAPAAGAPAVGADPCAGTRTVAEERCALAGVAREHATAAAATLREAQRAYDVLRERLDRAQAAADPRELAAAKNELHRRFREANEVAGNAEAAEAAARDWLHAINDLNARARDAARFLEAGGAELRAAMPGLERLSVEADAARISAETAEAGCQEARERLAVCEEQAADDARQAVPPAPPEDEHPFDALWPAEHQPTFGDGALPATGSNPAELPVILRMLRGDRDARDRVVVGLAGDDPEATREWQLRLTGLMDAIVARSIEAGYLDLPDDGPFWGMFEHRERRDIVGALSALGYRFDGLGGFADGRVPAARDLSLAVGYAGLDRMRVRAWPRESELAALYEHATVAAPEWLVDEADDLALGRMVDALGSRAGDLADVWNAWGHLRPVLLATD